MRNFEILTITIGVTDFLKALGNQIPKVTLDLLASCTPKTFFWGGDALLQSKKDRHCFDFLHLLLHFTSVADFQNTATEVLGFLRGSR